MKLASADFCHDFGQKLVLGGVNPFLQRFESVGGQYCNLFLRDDFAAVEVVGYEVHCAARLFRARLERLLYGVFALERRQKAGVDVTISFLFFLIEVH